MPLRVCTNEPSSNETRCPNSAIIAAINYAGANGARVANMSLGGTEFNQAEVNAIAANPGTLYVISAGNDSANNDSGLTGKAGHHYPCDYQPTTQASPAVPGAIENIICVAALDPSEALASYSDYGTTSVDIGAPGTAVLSTFPATETLFSDNFETNDFATRWTPFGAPGFGRAGVGEGPLTSFGITDTPGATAEANHIYGVKLTSPIAVAAGTGACRVEGRRFRKGGGSTGGPYGVIVDGSEFREFNGGETSGSAMVPFRTILITGLGGHTVAPFFEYRASGAPASGDGLWLDDVALRCNSPLSVPPGYSYLEGTSMAAPHVSGAAALLFSLKPAASVTEVREALLNSVSFADSLKGKVATGGKLDVGAAMNALVPPVVTITEGPSGTTTTSGASFKFTTAEFSGPATTECSLDGAPFVACTSPKAYASLPDGTHEFTVLAEDAFADTATATRDWTVDTSPPLIAITEGPTGTTAATTATFRFTATDPTGPATTECSLDGAPFVACASPKTYAPLADGGHEFKVRAEDALGHVASLGRSWVVDTASHVITDPLPPGTLTKADEVVVAANPPATPQPPPAVPSCTVPKLAGKTLAQAKAALGAAGCKLGKVTSPKGRPGSKSPPLVVNSSNPAAGSHAAGAVAITLAAKPKAKHKHH
jgi:hypothetical protein